MIGLRIHEVRVQAIVILLHFHSVLQQNDEGLSTLAF
jgi:hypothetical protein